MARKRRRAADPWKLKSWYEIVLPPEFGEKVVGETAADEPEKVIGRTVEVPASDITGNFAHTPYKVLFRITSVSGNRAQTRVMGLEVERAFLKRFTRRRTSKIERVFDVKTKDRKILHVKADVFTATKVTGIQDHEIGKIIVNEITEYAKGVDASTFVKDIYGGGISKRVYEKAKKIAPIKRVEVAKCKIIGA